jgi:sugar transferase (PEP-CTERM system associated)
MALGVETSNQFVLCIGRCNELRRVGGRGGRLITLFRHHIPIVGSLQLLTDGLLYFAAMLLAAHVALAPSTVNSAVVAGPASLFAALALLVGCACGVYRAGDSAAFPQTIGRVVLSLLVTAGIAVVLFEHLPDAQAARSVIGYAVLYSIAAIVLSRQALLTALRAGIGRRPVLIVGAGEEARAVQATLESGPIPKFSVAGFYPARGEPVVIDPGSRLFSDTEELCALVRRLGVRDVIVAVRDQRGGAIPMQQLLDCRVNGVSVMDLAGFYEREHGQVRIESLKSSWLVYGRGFEQGAARNAVKRGFDIVCAVVLLLLAVPVMAAAAVAIALESGRPILFRQERVGRGGRTFTCIKFRSMHADAERDGVPRWAAARDPRVTRVGRVLRTARIDELPQLVNVLRGDMSLVGPRPERPMFVRQLASEIPYYDVRHSVKPGITGWAQVRYTYGASVEDATRKLQYDLYYVKNHSLFLDVLILIETVRVVLFGEGAH